MWILITFNSYYKISDQEYKEILAAGEQKKAMYLLKRTGETISLRPFPSIMQQKNFIAQENDRLSKQGKRRCKFGTIHTWEERCECKRSKAIVKQSQFSIYAQNDQKKLRG